MSYRAGVSLGAARAFGIAPGDPHVSCDGCGLVQSATRPSGQPYAWLLNGKAPPGWMLQRNGDARRDFCPKCRDAIVSKVIAAAKDPEPTDTAEEPARPTTP